MDTYQQIHDFTPAGAGKFADFIAEHAKPELDAGMHKLECLGVIEDNLNSPSAGPEYSSSGPSSTSVSASGISKGMMPRLAG